MLAFIISPLILNLIAIVLLIKKQTKRAVQLLVFSACIHGVFAFFVIMDKAFSG